MVCIKGDIKSVMFLFVLNKHAQADGMLTLFIIFEGNDKMISPVFSAIFLGPVIPCVDVFVSFLLNNTWPTLPMNQHSIVSGLLIEC